MGHAKFDPFERGLFLLDRFSCQLSRTAGKKSGLIEKYRAPMWSRVTSAATDRASVGARNVPEITSRRPRAPQKPVGGTDTRRFPSPGTPGDAIPAPGMGKRAGNGVKGRFSVDSGCGLAVFTVARRRHIEDGALNKQAVLLQR